MNSTPLQPLDRDREPEQFLPRQHAAADRVPPSSAVGFDQRLRFGPEPSVNVPLKNQVVRGNILRASAARSSSPRSVPTDRSRQTHTCLLFSRTVRGGSGSFPPVVWNVLRFAQQTRLRAHVPLVPVVALAQWFAVLVGVRFPPARLAVDQDDVGDDVVEEVREDVLLDDVAAIDVLADFGVHLVPRAADVGIEEPAERTEVFVEVLRVRAVPAASCALAGRRGTLPAAKHFLSSLAYPFPGRLSPFHRPSRGRSTSTFPMSATHGISR